MTSPSRNEPRIPRLSLDDAARAAEAAGLPPIFAPLNVFRVLLHHPKLAKAVVNLLTTLLFEAKLDARLRELVILRIGWKTGSVYEWTQHWRIARAVPMSHEDCLAVRDWRSYPGYSAADRAVLAATDETLEDGAISPSTFAECSRELGSTEATLELVVAIGNWRLFSSMLRSLEIPLEDDLNPWPPDGVAPQAVAGSPTEM